MVGLNERFPGPAALNRAYTLTNDVRDGARAERLATVGGADGVWRCHQLFNCASACPRHLVPTQAIRQLRLDSGSEAPTPLAAPCAGCAGASSPWPSRSRMRVWWRSPQKKIPLRDDDHAGTSSSSPLTA